MKTHLQQWIEETYDGTGAKSKNQLDRKDIEQLEDIEEMFCNGCDWEFAPIVALSP